MNLLKKNPWKKEGLEFVELKVKSHSERKKRRITSVLFTLLIIGLLIFSGPVRAILVKVYVDDTDGLYKRNQNVVFTVHVDIETDELIPIQNFTLIVKNSTSSVIKNCTFNIDGTNLTNTCSNLNITTINTGSGNYSNNTLWGYGYGYNFSNPSGGWGNINASDFGTGYGYGYSSGYAYNGTYGGEFKYNITWNLTAEDLSDGNYTANLEAVAEKGSKAYKFKQSTDTSFQVDRTVPSITVSSVGGDTSSPYATTDSTPAISITTVGNATCRYSSSDVGYGSMTDFSTTGGSSHSVTLPQLVDGLYTYYIKCQDDAGNEDSETISFTLTVPGVAGGAAVAEEPKQISTIESLAAGESATITIAKGDEIGVTEITIEVKNDVNDVTVTVQKLSDKPVEIVEEVIGSVYRYLRITTENLEDEDVEEATVRFKIEKLWLEENDLDHETVLLNRYADGEWEGLTTSMVDEDDTYYYYEATLTGFSYFSITAQKKGIVERCGDGVCQAGETYETCPQDCPKPPEAVCGDGVCEAGENCGNCLQDCPCAEGYECKNNVCIRPVAPPKRVIPKKWFIIPILILISVALIVWLLKSVKEPIRKTPYLV